VNSEDIGTISCCRRTLTFLNFNQFFKRMLFRILKTLIKNPTRSCCVVKALLFLQRKQLWKIIQHENVNMKHWKKCCFAMFTALVLFCLYLNKNEDFWLQLNSVCIASRRFARPGTRDQATEASQHFYKQPNRHSAECYDVLKNMSNGTWFAKSSAEKKYYDDILMSYWHRRKIVEKPWRDDGKCGIKK